MWSCGFPPRFVRLAGRARGWPYAIGAAPVGGLFADLTQLANSVFVNRVYRR